MRGMLAAEKIGEVDHPCRLGRDRRRHDIVELGDVAAHDPDLLAEVPVGRGAGIDVHADHFLAALRQQRHEAAADEAGSTEDQCRHRCLSLRDGRIA